jgi:hypothetical protein
VSSTAPEQPESACEVMSGLVGRSSRRRWAAATPSAAVPAVGVRAAETWPVTESDVESSGARDPRDPSTSTALAKVIGTCGVAALGNGPRLVRDEPGVDWSAVAPEASTRVANRIATWPSTGVPLDPPIEGWWSDGGRVASLDGSIRELSGYGRRGLSYLERIDGSPWPPGRYESHVGDGDEVVAIVVCRRGAG